MLVRHGLSLASTDGGLLALFLILICIAPALGAVPDEAERFPRHCEDWPGDVEEFLDAFRRSDEVEMTAAAARIKRWSAPDLYILGANPIFGCHVLQVTGSLPRQDCGEALFAFSRHIGGSFKAEGLEDLVIRWNNLTLEELQLERKLRESRCGFQSYWEQHGPDGLLEHIGTVLPETQEAPWSITALQILWQVLNPLEDLGRHVEWRPYLEKMARRALDLDLVAYAADRLLEGANLLAIGGEFDAAIACTRWAVEILEQAGERRELLRGRMALGNIYRTTGRFSEARGTLEPLEEQVAALGEPRRLAKLHQDLGLLYNSVGQYAEALQALEQSERLYGSTGETMQCAVTVQNQGVALKELGRYAAALDRLTAALSQQLEHEYLWDAAICRGNLGDVYLSLGRADIAEECIRDALAYLRGRMDKRLVASSLTALGAAWREQGEWEKARNLLEEAESLYREMGDLSAIADSRTLQGDIYRAMGQEEKALGLYREALEQKKVSGNRVALLQLRARVLASQAGSEEAAARARGLAAIAAELEAKGLSSAGWVWLEAAEQHFRAGSTGEAFLVARHATELATRQGLGLGETEGSSLQARVRRTADLGLESIAAMQDGEGLEYRLGHAWELDELARALYLSEGLVNRRAILRGRLPADLVDLDAESRRRLDHARKALDTAYYEGATPESVSRARQDLDAAYLVHEKVLGRIERELRRGGDLTRPDPVGLDALSKILPEYAAFVAYRQTPRRLLAFVVRPGRAVLRDLGPAQGLDADLKDWLRLARTPGTDDEQMAAALYGRLLAPLEADLEGVARLILSPDGLMNFLPFEALCFEENGATRRLAEKWEMAYVPSGTSYVLLKEAATALDLGAGILAVGDPDYGGAAGQGASARAYREADLRGADSPLPGSRQEVRRVARHFPRGRRIELMGKKASRERLIAELDEAGSLGVLHLATHGHVDTERPRLTGLVLAGRDVLSLDDVYRLDLEVGLVVLSACDTGRGKLVSGEGVMGLVRGFFFAGAARVVVTDWRVGDRSTVGLMETFYEELSEGKRPGEALREAKLKRVREGGELAHPHHWAGFVLWGLAE